MIVAGAIWLSDHPGDVLFQFGGWQVGVPVLLVGVEFLFRPGDQPGALHLLTWTLVAYLGWTLVSRRFFFFSLFFLISFFLFLGHYRKYK